MWYAPYMPIGFGNYGSGGTPKVYHNFIRSQALQKLARFQLPTDLRAPRIYGPTLDFL